MDDTTFVLGVSKKATLTDLKDAIRQKFQADGCQVSWPHVWGHFCLSFRDQKLLDEHLVLHKLGVRGLDELVFVRHLDTRPQKGRVCLMIISICEDGPLACGLNLLWALISVLCKNCKGKVAMLAMLFMLSLGLIRFAGMVYNSTAFDFQVALPLCLRAIFIIYIGCRQVGCFGMEP
ncbi:hypothetical protein GOP47_0009657 [Adiantum capillus-veneris]|uniref:SNRNP25 ubiquitin-like domain-containing protein n=1 Tax=Adiantum capillus-veneris TaxID=13818 RepID=A0A9D4ZJP9_ADICA|nr:hypothetical protein GOP47_0009657 [Adiantum capillus-veneris]